MKAVWVTFGGYDGSVNFHAIASISNASYEDVLGTRVSLLSGASFFSTDSLATAQTTIDAAVTEANAP